MDPIVATLTLTGRSTERSDFEINATVGMPYPCEGGDWACQVSIVPLHDRIADIHGADSFQALSLATSLVLHLLNSFVDDGGILLIGGEDVSLGSYCFS